MLNNDEKDKMVFRTAMSIGIGIIVLTLFLSGVIGPL